MTDSSPSKTLRLKPKKSTHQEPADDQRPKRSGARARQAALQERALHARGEDTPETSSPRSHTRDSRPGTAPRWQDDQAPGRSPSRRFDESSPSRPRSPARQTDGSPSARPRGASRRPDSRTDTRRNTRADDTSWQPETRTPRARTFTTERRRPDEDSPPRIQHKTRRPRAPFTAEVFHVFAPCPHGLEEALSLELQALGYDRVEAGRAGCHFDANWTGILRANLYSRLATRILVQLAHAPVQHEDDILALARETEWERWFGPEDTLRVDTSAIHSPMQSLQYCNLRAKDGICDRLREREGSRPDIDTVRPDARVHLFLDATHATLYLDVSGESLFKRGWRLDKGEAPLRENLAAGLLALSGWQPDAPLLDPFCGSGTILIEAAWIALGVPAGIWRPFGFERLRPHDARLWRDLKEDARSHIAPRLEQPLVGSDIDAAAIEAARANTERAHLSPGTIDFRVCDARQMPAPADHGWIVTNPPYGERLGSGEAEIWSQWASQLKQQYAGWQLNVITSDLDFPKQLRLKARRRHPLHNGALDCRLFQFDLVAKGYRNPPGQADDID